MTADEIYTATVTVLEETAFLSPTSPYSSSFSPQLSSDHCIAAVRLGDEEVVIWAPNDLAVEVASNMLGLNAPDKEDLHRSKDALGEVANMIGGLLMKKSELKMSTPFLLSVKELETALLKHHPLKIEFSVEEHKIGVAFIEGGLT